MDRIRSEDFTWAELRSSVFEAYHRCLRAMAESGCNVLADHIIESEAFRVQLFDLLQTFDVYIVAVRCPPELLVKRERKRGDRKLGDALRDAASCYDFCRHDLNVDSSFTAEQNARIVLEQWTHRGAANLGRFRR